MSTTLRALARTATRTAIIAAAAVIVAVPAPAFADTGIAAAAVKTLPEVIAGLQAWIMGILVAVATLYLVIAGLYYATAGGDPAQVEKAKAAGRSALIGYAIAALAPVLLGTVQSIVGG